MTTADEKERLREFLRWTDAPFHDFLDKRGYWGSCTGCCGQGAHYPYWSFEVEMKVWAGNTSVMVKPDLGIGGYH